MLNRHSQIAIPPEAHFIRALFLQLPYDRPLSSPERGEAFNIISRSPRFSTWQLQPAELQQTIDRLRAEASLSELVDAVMHAEILDTGKPFWGEKTPENIDVAEKLASAFPDSKFLLVTRDGRDVAESLLTAGWQGWTVQQRAAYWTRSVHAMKKVAQRHRHAMWVKYEDLVLESESALQRICDFLGVAFEADMLRFYDDANANITKVERDAGIHRKLSRPPTPDDVDKWRTSTPRGKVFLFECSAANELQSVGYELQYYNPRSYLDRAKSLAYTAFARVLGATYHAYHAVMPAGAKRRLRQNRVAQALRNIVRAG